MVIAVRCLMIVLVMSQLIAPSAFAVTYYWDNNGATAGFGTASGTWAAPTTNSGTQGWSTDATGATLPSGTTTIATGDGENFGTATVGLASGTVTVSGTVAAGNITFGAASGAITLSGGTINMGNSQIIVNNTTDTIASVLGGTNPLTKAGTGTLVLTGVNTRTGALTVSAGTLQFGGASSMGPSGAFSSTIALTGTLQYSSSAAQTFSGVISGTGAITKDTSSSALTLSAVNTYTGATTVSAGTLNLTGNRTAVMGGTVDVLGGGATLNISGDLPMGAQQLRVGSGTSTTGTINQTAGAVTFTSGNQLTVGTTSTSQGIYNLSGGTFTTAAQANRGIIIGVNASTNGVFNLSGTGVLNVVSGSSLQIGRSENVAATGASGTFTQTGGTATVAELRMGGNNATNNANQVATLNLSAGTFVASSFTALSGGNGSSSTINVSGTADVTLPAFPTGAFGTGSTATVNFDGGLLRSFAPSTTYMSGLTNAFIKAGGAKFDTTNGSITIAQSLLTDAVSTGGGLTKQGTNTLTLAGASTYTGATTVNAGTLALDYTTQNNSKLSDTAALVLGGGTVDLVGGSHTEIVASTTLTAGTSSNVTSSTPGSVLQMGTITANTGATLNFGAGGIATVNNTNTNGILGYWATVGGNDWAVNSTNSANGLVTAYTGYADVQRLTPGVIADGAANYVRLIEGSGAAGNITLGAPVTTINSLIQSASGGSSAATIALGGQTLRTNAILVGTGAGALTVGSVVNDGVMSSASAGGDITLSNSTASGLTINSVIADNTSASTLTKLGTTTVTLLGANTYTGATTIGAGTLQIGNGGTTGSINGTSGVTNNGALVYSHSNTQTVGYAISGTGTLTKQGPGTLILANNNTYTGATTISAGTLQIGNGGTAGSMATTSGVTNNAALVYNRSDALTAGYGISGTGTVTQSGAGVLTLAGANTYTGGTTVSPGSTLQATITQTSTGLGTGAVVVGANSTLILNDTSTTNTTNLPLINNVFTGTGLLKLQFAAGTTARNTYMPNVTGYAGTIQLSTLGVTSDKWNATNLGTIAGSLVVDSGATLYVPSGSMTFTGGMTINGVGNNETRGAIRLAGTLGGNINLASNATISMESVANGMVTGNISSGAVGTQTLTLGGTGSAGGTVSGIIGGGTGTLALSTGVGGTYTLTGANTYTGVTTIAASTTLQLGDGTTGKDGTIESSSGIANSGTLTFNRFGSLSSNVAISGTGAVIKNGTGTQTLTANNTYTGATTVNAGTLVYAGDNSATTGLTSISGGTLVVSNIAGVNLTGGAAISTATASGTLRLATDTSVNPFPLTASTSFPGTIIVDRATPGAGITHTLGAFASGGNIWTIQAGSNVTSGTAGISIASLNLSAGSTATTTFNPTTATVLIPGAVNIGGNSAAKTLALSGTNAGNEISGVISDGLNVVTLTKLGTSTWTLSGANSYTGPTTVNGGTLVISGAPTASGATTVNAGTLIISGSPTGNSAMTVNGGTLTLDYSTNNTSKINDLAVLTLGNATVNLIGGTHTEVVASTTLSANGAASITSSVTGSVLQMGTITRGAGSVVNFGASNIATTNNTNTNGILGGWATVGGTDWATNSTNSPNGPITAYTGYVDVPRLTPGVIADDATSNVRFVEGAGAAGNITLGAAVTTVNTINQSVSGGNSPATIGLGGQTLRTGGILSSTGAGALTVGSAVGDGVLTAAAAGGDLSVINNSAAAMTINSVIADNTTASTLTKSGPGILRLTGANTFTGGTTISGGTLQLSGAGTLGPAGSSVAVSSGALLDLNGTNQIIKFVAGAGVGTVANNSGSGVSTLTLAGTATINGSVVQIVDNTTTPGGKVAVVITANTQPLNNTNTYSGGTTINAGAFLYLQAAAPSAAGTGVINLSTATSGLVVDGVTYANDITGTGYVHNNANSGATVVTTTFTGNINTSGPFIFRAGTGVVYEFAGNGTTSVLSGVVGSTTSMVNGAVATGSILKSGTGTLTLSGANLYSGTTTVNDGILNLTGNRTAAATGGFSVGTLSGSTGTLNVTNGTFTVGTSGSNFLVGAGGTGILNQSGGSLTTIGNQLLIGNGSSTGTYNLSGGTLTTIAGSLGVTIGVNTGSTGTFNLSGTGTLTMPATSTLQITRSDNSPSSGVTGTFNQTGGTATVGILQMGGSNTTPANNANANATLNLSGGTFAATTFNQLSGADNSTSTINISGTADVTLPAFPTARGANSTATINFDGGKLRPAAASATFMGGLTNAFIKAGGLNIEIASGRDITISQALLADPVSTGGGLTKSGDPTVGATLTLTGANTYTGGTTINAGRIAVSTASSLSTGTITITGNATVGGQLFVSGTPTIANNFVLSGVGFPDTVTTANTGRGGAIRAGSGQTFTGTMTLAGDSRFGVIAGATSNTISGQITGNFAMDFYGGLSTNAVTQTFVLANVGAANNYSGNTSITSIDFAAARTGGRAVLQLGASEQIPNGTGKGNLVFNGADANHIAVLELNGFSETVNGLSNAAAAGAVIQNTATGASTLTIGDANTTSTYSGAIADGGVGKTLALNKIGTGSLTLSGASSFTGDIAVNNGSLIAAAVFTAGNTALGSPSTTRTITVNAGGTLQFVAPNVFNTNFSSTAVPTLVINGGTVTNANPGAVANGINNALNNVTLANGTLTATVGQINGYAAWNINGTITSTGTSTISTSDPVNGTVMLTSAGNASTTVDVQSGLLTISAPLVESTQDAKISGLTKIGTGTLTLSAASTYSGGTTVAAGTLVVSNASGSATGTGSLTLNGGTFASGVAGSISGTVIAGSGAHTIAPGGIGSIGALTVGGLTLSANTALNFDITSVSTLDVLTSSGALSIASGIVNVQVPTGLSSNTYKLIGFGSTALTDATGFMINGGSIPAGYSLNLNTSTKELDLIVASTGPVNLTWGGGTGGWSSGGAGWLNGVTPTNWSDANNAIIGSGTDTAGTITVSGTVKPTAMTFNAASTGNYTVTGGTIEMNATTMTITANTAATINSTLANGSLTKAGTATLTLTGTHTYSGATNVSAGTLQVGTPTTAGSIAASSGVTVASSASFVAGSNTTVKSLNLSASNANASILAGALRILTVGDGTSDTGLLDLSGTNSKLDLNSGAMVLNFNSAGVGTSLRDTIKNLIGTGKIMSSRAVAANLADPNTPVGIGYALGDYTAVGLPSDATSIVARYTLVGDANLDGVVDVGDLGTALAPNYGSPSGNYWQSGDFNGDGAVDTSDLALLAANYGKTLTLPGDAVGNLNLNFEQDLAQAFASVPEPGTLSVLGLAALALLKRRNRSSRKAA